MSKSTQDSQTFSSQNALLRIAMGANIIAWVILAFSLLDLISNVRQIVQSWPLNLPPALFDQVAVWANFLSKYFVDLFYVFALLGIAQLIYLGMDIFFAKDEASEPMAAAEVAGASAEAN
jgi:hypothetical protein